MAIDDNVSYELTGAQIKDLANRINNAGGSVDGNKVWYATSSSSGYTSNKTATISGGSGTFALETGVTVLVKFSTANTASYFTLNVNNTGAINVYTNGNSQSSGDYMWKSDDIVGFVYDGSYWRMIDSDRATSSAYGEVKLATSYTDSSSTTVPTSAHLYSVYNMLSGKQNQLTAGAGITIDQNNVISATGGSYTYSGSVDTTNNSFTTTLSDGTTTQDVTLNAGTGITFSSQSSGPSLVGPTPANSSTDATQISGLTFTPGSAGAGYFYVLRVGKSSTMSGDVYDARLYKSNQSFNFTSQAEVEAAIWPTGQQIDVNPNNSGTMSGFFDSSFQSIEYVSGKSTAAEAIAAVYTAEATFGGTVTFNSQYVYVDVYVYVMGQGASTLTISSAEGSVISLDQGPSSSTASGTAIKSSLTQAEFNKIAAATTSGSPALFRFDDNSGDAWFYRVSAITPVDSATVVVDVLYDGGLSWQHEGLDKLTFMAYAPGATYPNGAITLIATNRANVVTYYMDNGATQGIPSYNTYIYSDAARTIVASPDTILGDYEAGNIVLLKYESTQTGSSAYDMTLQVNSMALVGADGYKMLVGELNTDNGNYNAVNTVIQTTWDGTGTFSSRWVLVRNVVPAVNLYTTTGQNTDGAVTQKLFTDTVGNIETILQTLNTGTGV